MRAFVSAGLLALLATRVDFGTVRSRLSGGSWGWFAAAVGLLLASFVVAALRWFLFLRAAGVKTTPSGAVRAYLIGTFTTNFLPSQIGGDVTRAWVAGEAGTRIRSATTVVIDRATALACLVLVGWLAFATDPHPVPGTLLAALGAAAGALVAAGLVIAAAVRAHTWLSRLTPARLRGSASDVRATARACFRGSIIWQTVLLGLAFQGLATSSVWLVARSISLHVPFSVLAVTLPSVLIVTVLPISIAGYGVREGSYVLLLGHAGVSTSDATLLSVLSGVVFALASLPGGLSLLRRRGLPVQLPEVRSPGGADRGS